MLYSGCGLKLKKVVKYQTGSTFLCSIRTGFSQGILDHNENFLNLHFLKYPDLLASIFTITTFMKLCTGTKRYSFVASRVKTNPKNAINEHFLPRFLDFIVWGHEHECLVDPQVAHLTIFCLWTD
jgi:hypothetical protein